MKRFAALFLILLAVLAVSCAPREEDHTGETFTVRFSSENARIGQVEGNREQTIVWGETVTTEVRAVPRMGYRFVRWSDGSTEQVRSGERFNGDTEIIAEFDYDILSMPVMSIYTDDRRGISSKTEYKRADCSVTGAGDGDFDSVKINIRGRGNYSWSFAEKKSYKIQFDQKINLLGQGTGPAKTWVLLGGYCDKTLLRNDTVFHFASQLENIPFVASSTFVELYLNDRYQGVYEVCEQIEVGKNRVDIPLGVDAGEDSGFLVEINKNAREYVVELTGGVTFEIKSEINSGTQIKYVKSYMEKCYEALRSGDREKIDSLIDIPSAVDCYIVEELFKNLDVGWGSFYFTRPAGGKLYYGPMWDFDLAAANASDDRNDAKFASYRYTYIGNPYFSYASQRNEFLDALVETGWFMDEVRDRWNSKAEAIGGIVQYIYETYEKYSDSINRNFERWDVFDKQTNREPDLIVNIKSAEEQVKYMANWLRMRISWLDGYLNGEDG